MTLEKEDEERLSDTARKAAENAYAPYSGYRVGAAVLCDDGEVYSGCNVENSSYGLTVCAERVAVFKAVSERPDMKIVALSVGTLDADTTSMCGACRQVVSEFAAPDCVVLYFSTKKGAERTISFKKLLPEPFLLKRNKAGSSSKRRRHS
ncbi:MAG: cytidine deaminase [Thermoprotei archaeon]